MKIKQNKNMNQNDSNPKIDNYNSFEFNKNNYRFNNNNQFNNSNNFTEKNNKDL